MQFLLAALLLILGTAGLFLFANPSVLLWLKPGVPTQRIVLAGSAANGTVIDCQGGWFNDGLPTELVIRSRKKGDRWDRPSDIVIRNTRLRGSIRIMGMGRNGEGEEVQKSSIREGHTARAQNAAPTRILLSGVEIEGVGGIPLYLAPGVTHVTVEHCRISGWSRSVGLYMDAESGHNVIVDTTFAVHPRREVLAVDGSAANRIEGNRFETMPGGGIYLYRNSGEGGTVRHQTPSGNVIVGNRFDTRSLGFFSYGIWLGSRNGWQFHNRQDAGYPFGSSLDDRDFATGNTVARNVFTPATRRAIRDNGGENRVETGGTP